MSSSESCSVTVLGPPSTFWFDCAVERAGPDGQRVLMSILLSHGYTLQVTGTKMPSLHDVESAVSKFTVATSSPAKLFLCRGGKQTELTEQDLRSTTASLYVRAMDQNVSLNVSEDAKCQASHYNAVTAAAVLQAEQERPWIFASLLADITYRAFSPYICTTSELDSITDYPLWKVREPPSPTAPYHGHNISAFAVLDGKIIAHEYNCITKYSSHTEHAEERLLYRLVSMHSEYFQGKELNPRIEIYSSLEPCYQCAGKLLMMGARKIFYLLPDPALGRMSGLDPIVHSAQTYVDPDGALRCLPVSLAEISQLSVKITLDGWAGSELEQAVASLEVDPVGSRHLVIEQSQQLFVKVFGDIVSWQKNDANVPFYAPAEPKRHKSLQQAKGMPYFLCSPQALDFFIGLKDLWKTYLPEGLSQEDFTQYLLTCDKTIASHHCARMNLKHVPAAGGAASTNGGMA